MQLYNFVCTIPLVTSSLVSGVTLHTLTYCTVYVKSTCIPFFFINNMWNVHVLLLSFSWKMWCVWINYISFTILRILRVTNYLQIPKMLGQYYNSMLKNTWMEPSIGKEVNLWKGVLSYLKGASSRASVLHKQGWGDSQPFVKNCMGKYTISNNIRTTGQWSK